MKDKKIITITCPCCGAEYVPGEIFYPKAFLGQPKVVEKDSVTKEILWASDDMNLSETFVCENCNTPFSISAKVQFTTKELTNQNFNAEYSSSLKKVDLFLNED